MSDALSQGVFAVVFSGIMLNDKELSEFGSSPEQIVAALYEKHGIYGFARISGPFTIVLQFPDGGKMLVRDPFGQKQFYYTVSGGEVRYSEKLADLLAPGMSTDWQAVSEYLSLGYIPAPRTIKSEIASVRAGYCVTFGKNGIAKEEQYYSPQFYPKTSMTYDEACEGLDALIEQATARCLAKCPNPGVLLSGGIDSNLVLCYANKLLDSPPDCITLYFDDKVYNESSLAAQSAQAVGAKHITKLARPEDFHEVPRFMKAVGEPFADSSLLASSTIMEYAVKQKQAVLMGDGGDELFGGYKRYRFMAIRDMLGDTLTAAGKPFAKLLRAMLPASGERRNRLSTLHRVADAFLLPQIPCYGSFQEIFSPKEVAELCPDLAKYSPYTEYWEKLAATLGSIDQAETANGIDLCTYLPEDGCRKDNVAAELSGICALSPMLDMDVAKFAISLPRHYKTTLRRSKLPLRTLAKGKLPPVLLRQPKRGFGIPVARWFRNELRQEAEKLPQILPDCFDKAKVRSVLEAHFAGKVDNGTKIWALLALTMGI